MAWPYNPRDRWHGRATWYATPACLLLSAPRKTNTMGTVYQPWSRAELFLWNSFGAGSMGMPGGLDAAPHSANSAFCATAIELLGMNNLKRLGPGMRDRTQKGVTRPMTPKGNGLWLPEDTCGNNMQQAKHPSCAVLRVAHPAFRVRHNEPVRASQDLSKMLLCWQGDRKLAIIPFPPSPAPWGWGSAGEGLYFLGRGLLLGHWESSPSLPDIGTVHGQGLPSSFLEQAAEADTYTGQNLFPNTSFISFSHEIFLLEYSLHLENRRVFFIRHIRL